MSLSATPMTEIHPQTRNIISLQMSGAELAAATKEYNEVAYELEKRKDVLKHILLSMNVSSSQHPKLAVQKLENMLRRDMEAKRKVVMQEYTIQQLEKKLSDARAQTMEAENEICQCNMKISQLQDPYDMEKDVNYVARKQNSTLQW